ncbi:hypothetical protein TIFTF001_032370 [Ficus carica]|uniref:Myb-like domain-containing protein n=1 Tax=Ficus carica TaxID=3494 RepID=A0AA88J6E4_FICCA|nr:hypothetical protein TIFTF001_032370 [Ficus carica]
MQSNYETAPETSSGYLSQTQHFTAADIDDSCSVPPFFPHLPLLPPNLNHHFSLLHHHQQDHLLNTTHQHHSFSNIFQQQQQQITPIFTHQFFQHWPQFHQEITSTTTPADQSSSSQSNILFPVNFRLGGDFLLDGNHHDALPDNRPYSSFEFTPKFCRQTHEYSSAKQPFCKDIIHIPNADKKNSQLADVTEVCNELEEIYGLVKNISTTSPTTNIGENNHNQLTGSGSALTAENSPAADQANLHDPVPFSEEETPAPRKHPLHKKKTRKRSTNKEVWSSMAGFVESLVEQVISHQDKLQSSLSESIERIDRERREREEEWRRQEAQTQNREAIARVHEQALASSREALIVSYLEKITGHKVYLPSRMDEMTHVSKVEMNKRWPKSEVEALIRARTGLELKFQEPGLIKGPIWEEVSALMAAMGYRRSAKRCKEKWENINKYFRKTKVNKTSAIKGSNQSKTCSYFDQLDQLYSRNVNGPSSSSSSSYCSKPLADGFGAQRQSYTELLEAITTKRDCGVLAKSSSSGKHDFDEIFHDRHTD